MLRPELPFASCQRGQGGSGRLRRDGSGIAAATATADSLNDAAGGETGPALTVAGLALSARPGVRAAAGSSPPVAAVREAAVGRAESSAHCAAVAAVTAATPHSQIHTQRRNGEAAVGAWGVVR